MIKVQEVRKKQVEESKMNMRSHSKCAWKEGRSLLWQEPLTLREVAHKIGYKVTLIYYLLVALQISHKCNSCHPCLGQMRDEVQNIWRPQIFLLCLGPGGINWPMDP